MFINRSRNKSGTTSVRVLQKRGRNNVLVKSFGSSRDESEIERMVIQAREFILRQTGTYYNIFNPPPEQDVEDFIEGLSNSQISVEGPEAVFGKLFDYVGYDAVDGLFRPLVLSRLVAPGSKLKTVDYLWRYNGVSYDVNKIYRYLDKLCSRKAGVEDIKAKIEQITFAHRELALVYEQKIYTAGTAAGPAFEGGGLSCGTPAVPGAISDVSLKRTLPQTRTIGNKLPTGICGSGAVSILSQLLTCQYMDSSGILTNKFPEDGLIRYIFYDSNAS